MSLTSEVYDAVLNVMLVYYGQFGHVLRNQGTNLICPPKFEDKSVLQFKKSCYGLVRDLLET